MTTKDNGGPAFPVHGGADFYKDDRDPTKDDPRNQIIGGGMTLRDWFAAQANDDDITNHQQYYRAGDGKFVPTYTREQAKYRYADAMLEARK